MEKKMGNILCIQQDSLSNGVGIPSFVLRHASFFAKNLETAMISFSIFKN